MSRWGCPMIVSNPYDSKTVRSEYCIVKTVFKKAKHTNQREKRKHISTSCANICHFHVSHPIACITGVTVLLLCRTQDIPCVRSNNLDSVQIVRISKQNQEPMMINGNSLDI